ncbi:hypothetical protein MYMA111404_01860 [Mycoplasma marinum]|uniref:Uncharacterized protein n=1 Tax=Mycoplasma marinum TaxID=1937190 RepID=A0A4R0XVT0_9MOLU|nr:hypothetical protein [Mycoplasma marinum]TCG11895.1 hypothetical protein C4B24_00670 [Mycoplasma marinum]
MRNKSKDISKTMLISLASLTSVAVPVVVVASCGSNKDSGETLKSNSSENIKSKKVDSKQPEPSQIKEQFGTLKQKLENEVRAKEMLIKLRKSVELLQEFEESYKNKESMQKILNSLNEKLAKMNTDRLAIEKVFNSKKNDVKNDSADLLKAKIKFSEMNKNIDSIEKQISLVLVSIKNNATKISNLESKLNTLEIDFTKLDSSKKDKIKEEEKSRDKIKVKKIFLEKAMLEQKNAEIILKKNEKTLKELNAMLKKIKADRDKSKDSVIFNEMTKKIIDFENKIKSKNKIQEKLKNEWVLKGIIVSGFSGNEGAKGEYKKAIEDSEKLSKLIKDIIEKINEKSKKIIETKENIKKIKDDKIILHDEFKKLSKSKDAIEIKKTTAID